MDKFLFNLISFIFTGLLFYVMYQHANFVFDVEQGNIVTVAQKQYICKEVKK